MWICFVLIWSALSINAQAANPYRLGELDYFKEEVRASLEKSSVFEWQDVVIGDDGRTKIYKPPDIVVELLERPTINNARVYLEWQRSKVQKIIQAQRMIDEVLKKEIP